MYRFSKGQNSDKNFKEGQQKTELPPTVGVQSRTHACKEDCGENNHKKASKVHNIFGLFYLFPPIK